MRKSIIFFALIIISFSKSYSQNDWNLDFNVGTLVGSDLSSSGISISSNVSYLFPVSNTIKIGPTVGYSRLFLNATDDFNFLPIAISGKIDLSDKFFFGTDLGYSVIIIDEIDGGFYYRPKIGYKMNTFNLLASYSGVTKNSSSISTIYVGVEFKL